MRFCSCSGSLSLGENEEDEEEAEEAENEEDAEEAEEEEEEKTCGESYCVKKLADNTLQPAQHLFTYCLWANAGKGCASLEKVTKGLGRLDDAKAKKGRRVSE